MHFSLTEVYFLGFSWGIKEGAHRRHTVTVKWPNQPTPGCPTGTVDFHSVFITIIQNVTVFEKDETFSLEKHIVF